jgi:hypothetical protein
MLTGQRYCPRVVGIAALVFGTLDPQKLLTPVLKSALYRALLTTLINTTRLQADHEQRRGIASQYPTDMHMVSGCGGMSWNAPLWFPASCATLLFSSMALVHGPLGGPSPRSRDWAAHARRCVKGASGRCCLPQFRSSVLVLSLFFRGCPRVWSCCSPLVAVSLLVVPSVVAHVHLLHP